MVILIGVRSGDMTEGCLRLGLDSKFLPYYWERKGLICESAWTRGSNNLIRSRVILKHLILRNNALSRSYVMRVCCD